MTWLEGMRVRARLGGSDWRYPRCLSPVVRNGLCLKHRPCSVRLVDLLLLSIQGYGVCQLHVYATTPQAPLAHVCVWGMACGVRCTQALQAEEARIEEVVERVTKKRVRSCT